MLNVTKQLTIAAAAAVALAATPVMARSPHLSDTTRSPYVGHPYAWGDAGYGAYAAEPEGFIAEPGATSNGRYTGWDPDPNVRLDLQKNAPNRYDR